MTKLSLLIVPMMLSVAVYAGPKTRLNSNQDFIDDMQTKLGEGYMQELAQEASLVLSQQVEELQRKLQSTELGEDLRNGLRSELEIKMKLLGGLDSNRFSSILERYEAQAKETTVNWEEVKIACRTLVDLVTLRKQTGQLTVEEVDRVGTIIGRYTTDAELPFKLTEHMPVYLAKLVIEAGPNKVPPHLWGVAEFASKKLEGFGVTPGELGFYRDLMGVNYLSMGHTTLSHLMADKVDAEGKYELDAELTEQLKAGIVLLAHFEAYYRMKLDVGLKKLLAEEFGLQTDLRYHYHEVLGIAQETFQPKEVEGDAEDYHIKKFTERAQLEIFRSHYRRVGR